MRKFRKTAALLLCFFCLTACGGRGEQQSEPPAQSPAQNTETPGREPEHEPSQTPYTGPVNPLTGLPLEGGGENARPVAIMLNNLTAALPQQGNGGADIIYEVVAEGGITRMLALYQSVEGIGVIGSVRSARPYYIELALGHDALYIHAGGSEQAYDDLSSWHVDHLDGVRGTYSGTEAGLFWRDRNRIEGRRYDLEHSLITSGDAVRTVLEGSSFRLEHESGYSYSMDFAEDGTPAEGESAGTVTVPFSAYKTGVFRYDAASGRYLAEEYGEAYIDGNTGEQIAVTNVLVLRAAIRSTGDLYGHMTVELSGGDGWFACGGRIIPITWEKDGRDGPLRYFTAAGSPLTLGKGKSYVNVIDRSAEIAYE